MCQSWLEAERTLGLRVDARWSTPSGARRAAYRRRGRARSRWRATAQARRACSTKSRIESYRSQPRSWRMSKGRSFVEEGPGLPATLGDDLLHVLDHPFQVRERVRVVASPAVAQLDRPRAALAPQLGQVVLRVAAPGLEDSTEAARVPNPPQLRRPLDAQQARVVAAQDSAPARPRVEPRRRLRAPPRRAALPGTPRCRPGRPPSRGRCALCRRRGGAEPRAAGRSRRRRRVQREGELGRALRIAVDVGRQAPGVAFASSTASCSESTGASGATGPKVSSRMTARRRAPRRGRWGVHQVVDPAATAQSSAPRRTASATWRSTRSSALKYQRSPSVDSSSGSPARSPDTRSAKRSQNSSYTARST